VKEEKFEATSKVLESNEEASNFKVHIFFFNLFFIVSFCFEFLERVVELKFDSFFFDRFFQIVLTRI
jgi:hypothetical protein